MKNTLITICCLLVFVTFAFAEVYPVSPQELAEKSDLIVLGRVDGIEKTNETVKTHFRDDVPVKYATIAVEQVIKGAIGPSVIVKYAYDKDMEADVQDPNFEAEERVLLYLQSNNDEKNSFSVVYGWSGVCRFYEGKFYHQYFEKDFEDYIAELKKWIGPSLDLINPYNHYKLENTQKIMISFFELRNKKTYETAMVQIEPFNTQKILEELNKELEYADDTCVCNGDGKIFLVLKDGNEIVFRIKHEASIIEYYSKKSGNQIIHIYMTENFKQIVKKYYPEGSPDNLDEEQLR